MLFLEFLPDSFDLFTVRCLDGDHTMTNGDHTMTHRKISAVWESACDRMCNATG